MRKEFTAATPPSAETVTDLACRVYFYWCNFGALSRGTAACGYMALIAIHLAAGCAGPYTDNIPSGCNQYAR
jgi:hypothetical protein